jgi:hypothetical protein
LAVDFSVTADLDERGKGLSTDWLETSLGESRIDLPSGQTVSVGSVNKVLAGLLSRGIGANDAAGRHKSPKKMKDRRLSRPTQEKVVLAHALH